jgi:hypothetical protein
VQLAQTVTLDSKVELVQLVRVAIQVSKEAQVSKEQQVQAV